MKISFIVPWISQGLGDVENTGHLMANVMANRGHEVHVYTFDSEKRLPKWSLHNSIKLHYLPQGNSAKIDSQMAVALAERCPDLIVGLHMNRTMLRYTIAAQKIGVPLILSEHVDPHLPRRIGNFSSKEREVTFAGATRIHLLTDEFVSTVPEYLRHKIDIIPYTVADATKTCDPVGGVQKSLITCGPLLGRRNLVRLIDEFALVAAKHSDWTLKVLGEGPLLKALTKRTQQKSVGTQVEFLGCPEGTYEHLEKSQLFVIPSLFENSSTSSLEAMAHGMPLIAYAAGKGLNEQIVDGLNGRLVADSLDPGSLASVLDSMMGDDEMRLKMGAASKQRFDSMYSNDVVFDAWEDQFKRAVSEGPAKPTYTAESQATASLYELVTG